jgi:ABC-type transporter Mla subunit MlaD
VSEHDCKTLCLEIQKDLRQAFIAVKSEKEVSINETLNRFEKLQHLLDQVPSFSIEVTDMVYDVIHDLQLLLNDLRDEAQRSRLKLITLKAQKNYLSNQQVGHF